MVKASKSVQSREHTMFKGTEAEDTKAYFGSSSQFSMNPMHSKQSSGLGKRKAGLVSGSGLSEPNEPG